MQRRNENNTVMFYDHTNTPLSPPFQTKLRRIFVVGYVF